MDKAVEGQEVKCVECHKTFIITESEERFYTDKGLYLPKRCTECRARRREERENKDRNWPPR